MNRRKYTVRFEFPASLLEEPTSPRVFRVGEVLWWDTQQTTDPVVFEMDLIRYIAPCVEFLRSSAFLRTDPAFVFQSDPLPDVRSSRWNVAFLSPPPD